MTTLAAAGGSSPEAAAELFALVSGMAAERDRRLLAEKCLAAACRIAGAGGGLLYALDLSGQCLVPVAGRPRGMAEAGPASLPLYPDREPDMNDPRTWCAFTGHPAVIENVAIMHGFDGRAIRARDRSAGRQTGSLIACPLRSNEEKTIGVLELCDLSDAAGRPLARAALETMVPMLEAFAYQAAVIIATNQLIERNQALVDELAEINGNLRRENLRLRQEAVTAASDASGVVTRSPAMEAVLSLVGKVVDSAIPVLVLGETGTGKEVIARLLHTASPRRKGPFVAQNCAALPAHLLESELFGYRKGAFTGAQNDKKGLFDIAAGGTLFLDEIGDMPAELQTKLLRILQDGEVRPLGAVAGKRSDARIVTATNVDLRARVAEGRFREDLYYRIAAFPIILPPLRERAEDIVLLARHFVAAMKDAHAKDIRGFTPAARDALGRYSFPGNVRELKNIVERAVILCAPGAAIDVKELPAEVLAGRGAAGRSEARPEGLRQTMRHHEAVAIMEALRANSGNRTRAAAALGLSRRALQEKIARYRLGEREKTDGDAMCVLP
ncbi:MAG TPA: sigma 54-interacting transcriptional regulator [Acetobacteraceae bacterium]|nr:sigma 54-interacting transcriptional regulator [Acetobacteraceae bacterium]